MSVDKVNHEFLHRLVADQPLDLVQDVLVQQQVDHMKRAWKMCLVVEESLKYFRFLSGVVDWSIENKVEN